MGLYLLRRDSIFVAIILLPQISTPVGITQIISSCKFKMAVRCFHKYSNTFKNLISQIQIVSKDLVFFDDYIN